MLIYKNKILYIIININYDNNKNKNNKIIITYKQLLKFLFFFSLFIL